MQYLRILCAVASRRAVIAVKIGVEIFVSEVVGEEDVEGGVGFVRQADLVCVRPFIFLRSCVACRAFEAYELEVSKDLVLRRCRPVRGSEEGGVGHVGTRRQCLCGACIDVVAAAEEGL